MLGIDLDLSWHHTWLFQPPDRDVVSLWLLGVHDYPHGSGYVSDACIVPKWQLKIINTSISSGILFPAPTHRHTFYLKQPNVPTQECRRDF